MLKHLLKRLLYSLMGRKRHSHRHYSSSDYHNGHRPYNRPHRGHGYYKKKYSSYSS
ncbi:hypothetical protein [Paenibacillus sp. PL91]|uniref:hypothetical protein n=1 Tax=Paenibacillus sp. PL91 TaxID=2729538 RepID=UPI00145CBC80|nr:hypothetical protein [Paenibacillus sp. PL91]MBC9202921.1 hypothetical protein [Paenibacillus sp. PL91]